MDDVADGDVDPPGGLEGGALEHLDLGVVQRPIRGLPLVILDQLLAGGDEQDQDQGTDGGISVGGRDVGDLLQDGGEEEEQVGVFGELLEEELGDEGGHVIFGRRHVIVHVPVGGVGRRIVEMNDARAERGRVWLSSS